MSIQHGTEQKDRIKFRNSNLIRWSLLTLLIFTSGCNRVKLSKEIDEFDVATNTAVTTITAYYDNLNEQEYDLYFQLLELFPNCEIGDKIDYGCINPKWRQGADNDYFDSPLKKTLFPQESIQARINLLKELTTYSKSLVALAGDKSPSEFQGNVTSLADKLNSLQADFQKLQNDRQNPDITAKQ